MPQLKSGDSMCYQHSRRNEVEKHKIIRAIDGTIIQKIPYKIARLQKGATPSQFMWTLPDTDLNTSSSQVSYDRDENVESQQGIPSAHSSISGVLTSGLGQAMRSQETALSSCSAGTDDTSIVDMENVEGDTSSFNACSSSSGVSNIYQRQPLEIQARSLSAGYSISGMTIISNSGRLGHPWGVIPEKTGNMELSKMPSQKLTEIVNLLAACNIWQRTRGTLLFSLKIIT